MRGPSLSPQTGPRPVLASPPAAARAWASAHGVEDGAPRRSSFARRCFLKGRRRTACAAQRRRRPTGEAPPTRPRGSPRPPALSLVTPGPPVPVLRQTLPRRVPRARRLLTPQQPVQRQHLPRRAWGVSSRRALDASAPVLRQSLAAPGAGASRGTLGPGRLRCYLRSARVRPSSRAGPGRV